MWAKVEQKIKRKMMGKVASLKVGIPIDVIEAVADVETIMAMQKTSIFHHAARWGRAHDEHHKRMGSFPHKCGGECEFGLDIDGP